MAEENCKIGLGNTGGPGCILIADVARKGLLDMAKDSAGNPKERDNVDLTTLSLLTAIINAENPLDRIYPVGNLDQVDHARADDVFFTSNSGQEFFIREGYKKFNGMIYGAPRELVGKLNANGKQNFGWHFLDDADQIVTKKGSTVDKCKPILVANQTFRAKYFEKTDSDPAGVGITFQWRSTEKDEDIKVLGGVDYTRNDIVGLLDADGLFTVPVIAGFTVKIFASCFPDTLVPNLVLADFSLEEISPAAGDITGNIASVIESSPGVYDFLFTVPETLGDVLRLSATKDTLDFSEMSDGTNDFIIAA